MYMVPLHFNLQIYREHFIMWVGVIFQDIDSVSTRTSPKVAEEETDIADDILALGNVVRRLLRGHNSRLAAQNSLM